MRLNQRLLWAIPLSINVFWAIDVRAQDSMLDLLGNDEEKKEIKYAQYSFKTNRVINLHSLESTAAGVMDFKMSHRFNTIDNGFYDLFGLDGADQRFGFDFGLTDRLSVGVNRNSFRKAFDGFIKYKFLRQSTGAKEMPITAAFLTSMAYETQKFSDPTRQNYNTSRLFYVHQLIVGRKFNDYFTLELVPTVVHRNLIQSPSIEKNDVFALGAGGRLRLTRRMTLNAEYVYVFPGRLNPIYKNSMSIGLDIETGGHVFQLHFTNSRSMSEYAFITQTENNWGPNAVRFGFNVSRVFTLWDTKKMKKDKEKGS